MKLRTISELNRRQFLAKGGGGALSILLGAGISPAMAKELAGNISPGSYMISSFLDDSMGQYSTSDTGKNAHIAWKGLKDLPKLLGLSGTTTNASLTNDGDALHASMNVNHNGLANVLANMVKQGWEVHPEGDGGFLLAKGLEEIGIAPLSPGEEMRSSKIDSFGSFLKTWWNNWGQGGHEPASDKFKKTLSDHGIDFYDREGSIYDQVFEYDMGHGVDDLEDIDQWIVHAEKNGYDVTRVRQDLLKSKRSKQERPKPEKPENIQVPQDHRVASPMHQSFESKLKQIFKTIF